MGYEDRQSLERFCFGLTVVTYFFYEDIVKSLNVCSQNWNLFPTSSLSFYFIHVPITFPVFIYFFFLHFTFLSSNNTCYLQVSDFRMTFSCAGFQELCWKEAMASIISGCFALNDAEVIFLVFEQNEVVVQNKKKLKYF